MLECVDCLSTYPISELDWISDLQHLKKISLRTASSAQVLSAYAKATTLTALGLFGCGVDDSAFHTILVNNPSLTSLVLESNSYLAEQSIRDIAQFCKNLTELSLSSQSYFDNEGFVILFKALSGDATNPPRIKTLQLHSVATRPEGDGSMPLDALPFEFFPPSIENLRLQELEVTPEQANEILVNISNRVPNLKTLFLRRLPITEL